jgi:hypothetical protein
MRISPGIHKCHDMLLGTNSSLSTWHSNNLIKEYEYDDPENSLRFQGDRNAWLVLFQIRDFQEKREHWRLFA